MDLPIWRTKLWLKLFHMKLKWRDIKMNCVLKYNFDKILFFCILQVSQKFSQEFMHISIRVMKEISKWNGSSVIFNTYSQYNKNFSLTTCLKTSWSIEKMSEIENKTLLFVHKFSKDEYWRIGLYGFKSKWKSSLNKILWIHQYILWWKLRSENYYKLLSARAIVAFRSMKSLFYNSWAIICTSLVIFEAWLLNYRLHISLCVFYLFKHVYKNKSLVQAHFNAPPVAN